MSIRNYEHERLMSDPQYPAQITRRTLLMGLAALPGLLLLPSCAKAPSSGITSPASGPQLFVTLTVAGRVNPSYYYFVLFNLNNAPGPGNTGVTGPIPVVTAPYANPFAAGAYVRYVEYAGGQFGYNGISADLLTPQPLGAANLVQASVSGSTLSFQLPISALATPTIAVSQIQTIQVNFVTTNVLPPPSDTLPNPPKVYDALQISGQSSSNSYLNIIAGINGVIQPYNYQNTSSGTVLEYVNGVSVPATDQAGLTTADLSVINFSLQITSQ